MGDACEVTLFPARAPALVNGGFQEKRDRRGGGHGAWSHYSRAIGDALQFAGVPVVEVHLSDVMAREQWRHVSVLSDACVATIAGQGVDGYHEALVILKRELGL